MNFITKIFGALQLIRNHPVNRYRKNKAVLEYGFVQVAARIVPGDVCVNFPNGTRLLIPPHMKGAAHYITPGLCEFEEMAFIMHILRPNELFVDVGANIGAFTVLASGVVGSRTIAFEANPDTFEALFRNVKLNGLQERVKCIFAAAGRNEGEVSFTTGLGTENHMVTQQGGETAVKVRMTSLDSEMGNNSVDILKIDVEGFETEVLAGAASVLRSPQLQALLIEKDNSGGRYGFDETVLHRTIQQNGFSPCAYQPFSRQLLPKNIEEGGNIIYIRDIKAASEKLRTGAAFKFGDLNV